jgi:flagellar protein FlaG
MKVEQATLSGPATGKTSSGAESIDRQRRDNAFELQEASQDPKKVAPEEILDKIKALTDNGNYTVRFEVNDSSEQLVIHLLDAESGEEIRQIPPEELLSTSENLQDLRGNFVNTIS